MKLPTRISLGLVLLACSSQAGWFSRGGTDKADTKNAQTPQAPGAAKQAPETKAPPPPPVEELAAADRDHTCAAGLVFDVYRNGASADPVRVEMSGGQCETVAAFEAAVSRAVCEHQAACHVRDGAGRRVRRCSELSKNSAQPGVQPGLIPRAYGVKRDMRWVFPTEEVGFKRYLPHLQITLTTLAEEPRLFALDNFLTEDDASQLIEDALAISDDEHKLTRSSVGAKGYTVSSTRTSENAWVKDTKTAMRMKRRAFELLGFDHYDERMADGLQVLRYNNTNGYAAHKDYLDRPRGLSREAMEPSLGGANRLATVFLYLSDVQHGGQTVFPHAPRPLQASSLPALESRPLDDEVISLRDAQVSSDKYSWEPRLINECYTKLAAAPKKGRAILFYSQHPDGTLDQMATHGGCPVLSGTKWASNLWIWNKAMPFGSSRFQSKDDDNDSGGVEVAVSTTGVSAEVFWVGSSGEEAPMGTVSPGDNLRLNSFVGHSFVARRNGAEVARYTVARGARAWAVPP